MDLDTVIAIVQEQLRKVNFEGFQRLVDQCIHRDEQRSVGAD